VQISEEDKQDIGKVRYVSSGEFNAEIKEVSFNKLVVVIFENDIEPRTGQPAHVPCENILLELSHKYKGKVRFSLMSIFPKEPGFLSRREIYIFRYGVIVDKANLNCTSREFKNVINEHLYIHQKNIK